MKTRGGGISTQSITFLDILMWWFGGQITHRVEVMGSSGVNITTKYPGTRYVVDNRSIQQVLMSLVGMVAILCMVQQILNLCRWWRRCIF